MGPTRKTTLLLPKAWHRQLTRLAAVEALAAMRLPVGPVEQMIAESLPEPQNPSDCSGYP
jgi:hypothetical protein